MIENLKRKLWIKVFLQNGSKNIISYNIADEAVKEFDKRFKNKPKKRTTTNETSW
jgi:hypothetical protein